MQATKQDTKQLGRLLKRSDFLWVQKNGRRWVAKGMSINIAENKRLGLRFGLTVTKKLEKTAVGRNRMKRRLRAAAADVLPAYASHNLDIVIFARSESATRLYTDLKKDLSWCLKKLEIRPDA